MRYETEYHRLKDLQNSKDKEVAHEDADEILCDILEKEGFEHIVSAYNKIYKWYA